MSASGEVDASTVETFQSHLRAGLDAATDHPAKVLIIELGAVTYFGSAGLNAVLACHERGASDGVAVRLVAANPEVIRPIEVTKLDTVLRPYDSVDAAVDGE